jgi:hypothetical protein
MVKFDITDYLVGKGLDDAITDGSDMIQWFRENVGELDAEWMSVFKIKPEDITNTGRGYGWAMHAQPHSIFYSKRTFTWIAEIQDDTAAMQFKLIWPEAKILNEQV